jgi:hypothetical protein
MDYEELPCRSRHGDAHRAWRSGNQIVQDHDSCDWNPGNALLVLGDGACTEGASDIIEHTIENMPPEDARGHPERQALAYAEHAQLGSRQRHSAAEHSRSCA